MTQVIQESRGYKVVFPKTPGALPYVDFGEFQLKEWLNPPKFPWNYQDEKLRNTLKITKAEYIGNLERVFDFRQPFSAWAMAKRFVGKSNLAQCLGVQFIKHGGTVIDIFSSADDEGLCWLKAYKKILLITGNKVTPKMNTENEFPWIHVGELKQSTPAEAAQSLKYLEKFEVVVTVPGFYYNLQEMYGSLSYLIDLLKKRRKWKYAGVPHVFCLIVREARELISSRFEAGQVSNKLQAENDLIQLHNNAFHTGVALVFDALRYTSITPDVRDIGSFTFMKQLGTTIIPRTMYWALRYVKPSYLRSMPLNHFVVVTDKNKVYFGTNSLLPWHVVRGTDPMSQLGISIEYIAVDKNLAAPDTRHPDKDHKADPLKLSKVAAYHKRIIKMKKEDGFSYKKIRAVLNELVEDPIDISEASLFKEVKNHGRGVCDCDIEK